ncbi:response regulator transcription factor [Parasutterella excrementihominis]|uniref:response regulator transcription factor n=1 Tax=Parasutterella excrementihominis TaxID=487175 RepID=UPI003AB6F382
MSEISPLVRLVDDDDAFRESQKLFLSMCGYEVKDWADPVRFLEEDDPRVPGCLVLDIRMPEMTGLELQRALYEVTHYLFDGSRRYRNGRIYHEIWGCRFFRKTR